jgi:hypothetical protein
MADKVKRGDRVSGSVQGQPFTGTVTDVQHKNGKQTSALVSTDGDVDLPNGRRIEGALMRGSKEIGSLKPLKD